MSIERKHVNGCEDVLANELRLDQLNLCVDQVCTWKANRFGLGELVDRAAVFAVKVKLDAFIDIVGPGHVEAAE